MLHSSLSASLIFKSKGSKVDNFPEKCPLICNERLLIPSPIGECRGQAPPYQPL